MRLLGDGAVRHGAGLKALDNFFGRLHLFQRNRRLLRHEIHQAAKRMGTCGIVHQLRINPELLIAALFHRLLQIDDGLRAVEVILLVLAAAQAMEADAVQRRIRAQSQRIKGMVVAEGNALLNFLNADSADAGNRAGKILLDHITGQTDGLENACRLVGLDGGNSHLRRNLDNAGQQCLVVVLDGNVVILVQNSLVNQLGNALMCQIRVDGPGTEAKERCHLVHISGLAGFQHNGNLGALFRPHQMLLHGGDGKERRNRHMVLIHAAV